jgi:tight adherence protein C
MNDLITRLQETLSAPDLWSKPANWIAVGCGALVLMLIVRLLFRRKAPAEAGPAARLDPRGNGGAFGMLTPALASQIPESQKEKQEFGQMLKQAGMYSPTARASVYAFRFLFMVFPLFVAGILAVAEPQFTWRYLIAGAVCSMALSILPRLYVWVTRQRRLRQINEGLSDMLDMLSMCLGGGMPLASSLDHVSRNIAPSYPALAEELQIMKKQTEVHSLRMALSEWANRLDTPEVRQVATILTRGDFLGSSLSGSLRDQADHFRTTRKQLATLRANRTPVLLTFPLMFCFAPAVLILLMSPAFLQLSDFFNPSSNPLNTNDQLTVSTDRIADALEELNQNPDAIRDATRARPAAE